MSERGRIRVNTKAQTGLKVSHDGKKVRGDLVDAVMSEARECVEENRELVRDHDRREVKIREMHDESTRKCEATSLHDRRMDTKHQLAANLRQSGMDPQRAEETARRAVEGQAREGRR